ncbi:MAG: FxLYD domain-containing protein [Thermodesulfobacteriota bacterium]
MQDIHNKIHLSCIYILVNILASTAYGEDDVIRLKSLDVAKVSEEKFLIKGEFENITDSEIKRISIKFSVYDPSGEIIEEDQVIPSVNPIPPHGSSPFLLPIKYSRNMLMDKVKVQFISFVGKEMSVDPNGYSLEFRIPK